MLGLGYLRAYIYLTNNAFRVLNHLSVNSVFIINEILLFYGS